MKINNEMKSIRNKCKRKMKRRNMKWRKGIKCQAKSKEIENRRNNNERERKCNENQWENEAAGNEKCSNEMKQYVIIEMSVAQNNV